jgi:hypothetical protein
MYKIPEKAARDDESSEAKLQYPESASECQSMFHKFVSFGFDILLKIFGGCNGTLNKVSVHPGY